MSGAASDTTRALKSRRVEYVRRLDDAVADLVRRLSSMEEVRRVSVFGSYACGRRDLFTDLDVLVVMETDLTYVERLRHLYGLVAQPVDLDLLCYTPQEFEVMRGSPFLRRALADERVLLERPAAEAAGSGAESGQPSEQG